MQQARPTPFLSAALALVLAACTATSSSSDATPPDGSLTSTDAGRHARLDALAAAGGASSGGASAAGGAMAVTGAGGNGGADASAAGRTGSPDAAVPRVTSFTVDVPNVVRRSDVVLGKANVRPQDAMALGNGTLGVAAWAANGFTAQLNRGDTFPDRKAVGRVVIPGLLPLTSAADFSGHVDLYDAKLVETGAGMSATAYVRADAPELVVEVSGADPSAVQTVKLELWSGRTPSAKASAEVATLSEYWVDSSGSGASGQTFGVLSGVTVHGRNVHASVVDALTVQVSFQPESDGTFRVLVAAPAWTGGDALSVANGVLGSDASAASAELGAAHLSWWHDYWSRVGLLKMTSPDGTASYLENLRTLYLFLTAAESRGTLPGSQAGLADLFDYLEDAQPWFPAGYWFWNTRMLVAANLSAGAFDMNEPVWTLYRANVANIEAWTKSKMGGRSGLCVPETMRFNGNGYWYGGENDASCDESASPNYNALTLTTGAEVALWIWQQYLTNGDHGFLARNYPVMSGAAQFLLAYATTGADGLLHTVANAHETQWNVKDPVTDIVAMRALFPAVIAAAGVLGTDATLVEQLTAAIPKIPPMPRTDQQGHSQLLTADADADGQDVFALSYEPTAPKHNGENLDLEAVWPYGLIGDEGPDVALAKRTYAHRLFVNASDWNVDALQAARLGLASEVASALTRSTGQYQSFVNGLGLLSGGTNDGKSEPYIEHAGVVAAALDEALVQDHDGLLRIAPAWPSTWDASGTVFIQGRSKVDVVVKSGAVVLAVLEAGSDGAVRVRNPWPARAATVMDGETNAVVVASTSASTLTVKAAAGRWYLLVPSDVAASPPTELVTGVPATKAIALGNAHVGL